MTRAVIACLVTVVGGLLGLTTAQADAAFGVESRFSIGAPPGQADWSLRDLAVDVDGHAYVLWQGLVQKYDGSGALVKTWGSYGSAAGQFFPPGTYSRSTMAIEVDGRGHVFVADHPGNRVVKFTTDGAFAANLGAQSGDGTPGRGSGEFEGPDELGSDANGNLFVADQPDYRITEPTPAAQVQKLSPDGTVLVRRPRGYLSTLGAIAGDRVYSPAPWVEAVLWLEGEGLASQTAYLSSGFSLLPGDRPSDRGIYTSSCCGMAVIGGQLWIARSAIRTLEGYGAEGGLVRACPIANGIIALNAGRDGRLYALTRDEVIRYGDQAVEPCDIEPPKTTVPGWRGERLLRASSYRRLRKAVLSFTSSEQGTAELVFRRVIQGRRLGRRCVRPGPRNRKRALCVRRRVREAAFDGIPVYVGDGGVVRFVDLLWRRGLPQGRYELSLTTLDRAGLRSAPVVLRARIVR